MLSDNQMISRRQASWIFMLNMLGAGLFSLTSVRTQVPSVSLLFSGLLTILVVIFYYMASFHIFEYYEKKTGLSLSGRKLPAAIILLWLMLYFPGLVWAMDFFRHVIEDRIPTAYGWMVPVLFLMAALMDGAGKGIEVRGRMAELMGWFVCVPFIILFAFGLWQAVKGGNGGQLWIETLQQERSTDIFFILKTGFGEAAFFLLGEQPLFLWRCIRNRKGKKNILSRAYWSSGIILMLSVCVVILLLSPKGTAGEVYPFGVVLQLIRFPGNFISRYDIFFMMLWMMSYFIFAGGMLLQLVEAVNLFIGAEERKKRIMGKKLALLFGMLTMVILLCGCYAEREPQNRSYIMCMGIDYEAAGWKISYGFPDLGALTGTDAGEPEPVRVIHASTIREAADKLEASSDKTTDYSQMPVILIEKKLLDNDDKRERLMKELAGEKAIRRTALVACAKDTAEEILELDDDVHGSVGVFIYELCQNNYENKGYTMSILEDFIGGRTGSETVIPVFENNYDIPEIIELMGYK